MTKASTPAEMSKGQTDNTNNATKNFDYTAIADRLRTVRLSNYGHPTMRLTGLRAQSSNFPQQPCNQKDTHLKIFKNKPPDTCKDNKPKATPSGEVIKMVTRTA